MWKQLGIATFVITVVSGCATPTLSVKEKWASSVRNYGVIPVYLMREDVFIGEVRVHRVDGDGDGDAYSLNSRRLTQIDLFGKLVEQEKNLPNHPRAEQEPLVAVRGENPSDGKGTVERGKPAVAAWRQPTAQGALKPGEGEPERLRLAALPKLELLRVTSADAGGSGSTGGRWFGAGGRVESAQTVILSLRGIETLELSDVAAVKGFIEYLAFLNKSENGNAKKDFIHAICMNAKTPGASSLNEIRVSVVTRVLYARAIEYTYGDSFGAALRMSVGSGGSQVSTDAGKLDGDQLQPPVVTITPGSNVPGVVAGVSRASRDGMSLTEVYERPLAFGVNVLAFQLEPGRLKSECSGALAELDKMFVPVPPGNMTFGTPSGFSRD